MINQYFNVIVEKDSDGCLVASVPVLKGCHTQSKSYDQLMERIQEAIELCLDNNQKNIQS
jgi:predicted RNase H-like HicB family nuclease